MPTVLKETYDPLPPQSPPRKRWTRSQCASLEASGIWEREQLELVGGELLSKMGKKRPHVHAASLLHEQLAEVFGSAFVNSEAPIDVAPTDLETNEPEPDLIVLARPSEEFDSNPRPEDLCLVVEIADSTLRFDLTVKAALYARAKICEYWVLDVTGRRLIVHRNPSSGSYESIAVFNDGESVAPIAAPSKTIAVSGILPRFK